MTSEKACAAIGPEQPVTVEEQVDQLCVQSGTLVARIGKHGPYLIDSLSLDGREIARHGRLVRLLQQNPPGDVGDGTPTARFTSEIQQITLEQRGPVRVVVRIQGVHQEQPGQRQWLPFDVRLYFWLYSRIRG